MNSKTVIAFFKLLAVVRDFESKILESELISSSADIITSYNSRNRHIASALANQRVSHRDTSLSCFEMNKHNNN